MTKSSYPDNGKLKIGMYWCASCGGCEEAIVDLAEDLLQVVEKVDIVFWPVAMDFKLKHVEAMADGEIDLVMINGAIQLSEQEEVAKLLRRKSKLIAAFGACAHMGGIPGLANASTATEILDHYYHSGPTVANPDNYQPDPQYVRETLNFRIPTLYENVRALDQVIPVDYYIPGCAPTPAIVKNALMAIIEGKFPAKGTVLAAEKALCAECALNTTKPDEGMKIKNFKRHHEMREVDPNTCLLTQGYICLGPVTRGGCDAMCIKANMPCTGCFGPVDNVKDFGASAVSYIASLVDSKDPDEIDKIINKAIPDPLGTFYMYSLPKSILYKKWQKSRKAEYEQIN